MRSFDNLVESLTGTGSWELEKRCGALCGSCCGIVGLGWSNYFSFVGTQFGILKSAILFS